MKTEIEGKLEVFSSEGGYGPDAISIDDVTMSEFIASHFGDDVFEKAIDTCDLGNVKITIESI